MTAAVAELLAFHTPVPAPRAASRASAAPLLLPESFLPAAPAFAPAGEPFPSLPPGILLYDDTDDTDEGEEEEEGDDEVFDDEEEDFDEFEDDEFEDEDDEFFDDDDEDVEPGDDDDDDDDL